MHTFTDENTPQIIAGGSKAVIDFSAEWCGPCQAMAPIIEKLAEEYEGTDIIIGTCDTEDAPDLSSQYRIMSIPAVLFFKDGQCVGRLVGSQTEAALRAKIQELLG